MRVQFAALLCSGVALGSAVAWAEPSNADKARARDLLNEGYDLMERGEPKAAVPKFREADELVHVPVTTLALARALSTSGSLLEARAVLERLAHDAPKPGEPRPFTDARNEGEALAQKLDARIPSIVVTVSHPPADVAVRLDGQPLPLDALGAPRKVNPGGHVVVATGDGREKRVEIALAEAETKDVTVDFGEPAQPAPAAAAPPAPERPPPAPETPARRPLWYTWVGFGVGVAGLGAGAVAGALALSSRNSAVREGCMGGQCPPAAQTDAHDAQRFAAISTIATGVGLAGVVAGVVGLLTAPSGARSGGEPAPAQQPAPDEARGRPHVHVVLAPAFVGGAGDF
jgi:hypothetical protein